MRRRAFLEFAPDTSLRVARLYKREMTNCEIIYFKDEKGWKWRQLSAHGEPKSKACEETYQLFYECVIAARANGLRPRIACS